MPPNNELGREAVSALATIAVVIGGTMALVFVIVVGSDRPGPYLGGVAAGVVLFCVLLFLARSQPTSAGEKRRPWWKIFRRRTEKPEPEIVLKRRNDPAAAFDSKQPPTAEQLRDIKDHNSTWVPNRTADRR
tara:strand:- start:5861 stop:6256 length:396 start_codon:yes stop_codon:yes gene_type:complete